jgi:hypothetical protein
MKVTFGDILHIDANFFRYVGYIEQESGIQKISISKRFYPEWLPLD